VLKKLKIDFFIFYSDTLIALIRCIQNVCYESYDN